MKPARAQAVSHDGARGEGGPHHGGGGEAHGEAERGLLRQQVVDAPRLGHQDCRHGETAVAPINYYREEKSLCTWLGELYYCSCLPVLSGPAWVLLSYVLQTFIFSSVNEIEIFLDLRLSPTQFKR